MKKLILSFVASFSLILGAMAYIGTAYAYPITPTYGGGTNTSSSPSIGSLLVGANTTTTSFSAYGVLLVGSNGQCVVASSGAQFGITWGSCGSAGGSGSVSTSSPITVNYFPFWTGVNGQLAGTSSAQQDSTGTIWFYNALNPTSQPSLIVGATSTIVTSTFGVIGSSIFSGSTVIGTTTPPSGITFSVGSPTSSNFNVFPNGGVSIGTTTAPLTAQSLFVNGGSIQVPGTLTLRGSGSITVQLGSDGAFKNSGNAGMTLAGGTAITLAGSSRADVVAGNSATSSNTFTVWGSDRVNSLNVTTTLTVIGNTSLQAASTTALSDSAVTSSPVSTDANGQFIKATITTTTITYSAGIDSTTTVITSTNTSTAATFYTYSLPGNTLGIGKTLRITAQGTMLFAGPSNTAFTANLMYNGTTVLSVTSAAIATSTSNGQWGFTVTLSNASGTTNNQLGTLVGSITSGGGAASSALIRNGTSSVDSTAAAAVVLQFKMSNTNTSTSVYSANTTTMLDGATTTIMTGIQ